MAGRGAASRGVTCQLLLMLSLMGAVACGVEQPLDEMQGLASMSQTFQEDNGLSLNGLSLNGLSLNGLSLNGLSLNGLNSADFITWFNSADGGNLTGHEALMKYLVRCAVPEGEVRVFVNPITGVRHVWEGGMGLAPQWSGGTPATQDEQQVISACLAAHANNYGVHVPISVLGKDAVGGTIPYSRQELVTFAQREACFFGNLFVSGGATLFAGNHMDALSPEQSTPRPCGLVGLGVVSNPACTQMQRIGQCQDHCRLEPNGHFYSECTYNGVTYKPLTTRIRLSDVNFCGDGVCQVGERKGTGYTADSCGIDCGT
ncbi:hypothetical protein [Cystobacter fuscus]|uniref:hypothetical protein n=1 Tax=Cystobacter fuscus TaxID=43 RepID=UPI0037BE75D3